MSTEQRIRRGQGGPSTVHGGSRVEGGPPQSVLSSGGCGRHRWRWRCMSGTAAAAVVWGGAAGGERGVGLWGCEKEVAGAANGHLRSSFPPGRLPEWGSAATIKHRESKNSRPR